jgi:ribosome-associated protein
MQLIGKLMRSADVEPARVAVAEKHLGRARDSLALHSAERWRAELIADDAATTRFASAHAGADLQQLRALVRNARKDAAAAPEKRSGRAYRELFQFIRERESDG